MSDDLKIQGEVSLDTTNADQALVKVEKNATRMADAIVVAGKKAGQGLADVEKGFTGIGAGGDTSSAKVERSTKSIISSIQRTTVQMEAGGKVGSKYYEILGNQRGVSADALRPYLDQLKKIEQAQSSVGISAAQTAAAMRNVPAQFTDIITSLQGGQKPLTVLLQQGGQLKDMFGGAGNAAKAMGTYVLGLISPVTLTAAAVGGLAYVYSQANSESKEFSKALITSNSAAGLSVDALRSLSANIEAVGASSKSVANDSLLSLVGAGNVASSMIEKAALASVRAQTVLSKAVADTASEFADLGKSPTAAVEKLNEKYHFLTLEIYEQIKAYEDQGRAADAAKLAQSSYADALLSQSDKVKATLTDWERGWLRIKTATSGAFGSVMTMFDDPTNNQKIEKLFKEREKLEESQKSLSGDKSFLNIGQADRVQKLLDQNKAEINAIRDKIKAKNDEAKAQEASNAQVAAGIKWGAIVEKNLDKQAKLELEIAKARAIGLAAGKSAKVVEEELAIIRKNGTEKAKKAIEDQSIAWQAHKANVAAAGSAETKVLADIDKSIAAIKFPNPLKEITEEFEKQTAAFVKVNAGLDEYALGLQGQNELAQLELSLIGQSASERGVLIEQYKIELALQKEIRKIKAEIKDAGSAQILIDKATSNAEIEKSQSAIKVQQQEWSKFYGDIYNGLTDSLYRGFESGKGFFKSFWDSVRNLFKTTVLKLAVQGVMTGVLGMGANGLANAQGLGAQGNGLSSLASMYSAGKSLWDGFSAAGTVGGGVTTLGNALGSSTVSAFGSGMSISSSQAASAAAAYNSAGMTGTGTAISAGSSVASALPIVGWVLAGMAANNSLYDKGWGGKASAGTKHAGIASGMVGGALEGTIQKLFGLSDKSASMWSGSAVVNRLFGHQLPQLQQSELAGSFNSQGVDASIRDVYKQRGGVFRGDIWSESKNPVAASQTKELSTVFDSMKLAAAGYASVLGLSADALNSFSKDFKVNLSITGDAAKDAEANAKIWSDLIVGVADDLSKYLMPNLADFAKEGEKSGDTFARIAANLGGVNAVFSDLNLTLFKVSDLGIKAASSFVDLLGGLDKFQAVSQSYYENFYTQEERNANIVKSLTAELEKQNLVLPSSRDGYRALVDEVSKTGTSEQLASLFKLSDAFASVFEASDVAGGAITSFAQRMAAQSELIAQGEKLMAMNATSDRMDLVAVRRASELAQETIRKASDDAFKTLSESVTSGMQNLIRAGDAGTAVASQMAISGIKTGDFATSSGYNSAAASAQAKIAKGLMDSASFDALNVQDVSSFMSGLLSFIFADDVQNSIKSDLARAVKLPEQGLIGQTIADLLTAEARDYTNKNRLARGSGIASVIGAQRDLSFASYHGGGADVEAYNTAVVGLSDLLKGGKINQDDYSASLASVNKLVGDSIGLMRDESAQRERIIASQNALSEAGIGSIAFYFDRIGKSVEQLNAAASQANTPLAQVTAGIGRLTSISDVFGQSAKAALSGGNALGNTSVINAQIVAEAAAKAAASITTADAAQAAKLLAGKDSFAGVGSTQLRDVSMILDGLKAFDSTGFEASFMRMNDALGKGTITQEQYQDIFATSLNLYEGIADQQERELKERTDFVDKLGTISGAMKDFYNSLLTDANNSPLSQEARMNEVMGLYDSAKMGLMGGDASRLNDFKLYGEQIANASNYSSRAEANYGYSRVLSDSQMLSRYTERDPNAPQVAAIQNLEKSISERLDKQFSIMRSQLLELQNTRLNAARANLPTEVPA